MVEYRFWVPAMGVRFSPLRFRVLYRAYFYNLRSSGLPTKRVPIDIYHLLCSIAREAMLRIASPFSLLGYV